MFQPLAGEVAFLAARLLFGGVLAFMGLNHFLNTEEMVGYASFKGLPAPRAAVLLGGAVLVAGGLAVVTGVFPAVGAAALAAFLVVSGATMHDFWNLEGEDAQTEMTQFLKNLGLAAGALAFAALAGGVWPYAANVGL